MGSRTPGAAAEYDYLGEREDGDGHQRNHHRRAVQATPHQGMDCDRGQHAGEQEREDRRARAGDGGKQHRQDDPGGHGLTSLVRVED
jgi:hypothetical protein